MLFLLEKPSPPRAPIDVSGMNSTSFTLSWEPSENDGGTKIIEYLLEICEIEISSTYTSIGHTEGNVTYMLIKNVEKDKAYKFRIYARNAVGTSEALETDDKIVVGRRLSE